MRPVFTSEEMGWCDETTIRSYGLAGSLLMENAGRGVALAVQEYYGPLAGKTVAVVCGKGKNAGDGFVAARHLSQREANVMVILTCPPAEFRGEVKSNFAVLRRIAGDKLNRVSLKRYSRRNLPASGSVYVVVDALFGTGFSGAVRKPYDELITWMNKQGAPVVAVDIPSGVNGSSGETGPVAVTAERTVTFGGLKRGLLCNKGREHSGTIHLVDIGIPYSVLSNRRFQTFLVEPRDVRGMVPRRALSAHKYSVGKVFVLAGSRGLTGAAALCSTAALRAGAGAVILGTPEPIYAALAKKLTEVMVTPLPATHDGSLAPQGYDTIAEKMKWADVVVVGPGLSTNQETRSLVERVVRSCSGNLLIDADGLNAVAALGSRVLKKSRANIVITPHTGEFARLTGKSSAQIEAARTDLPRSFSREHEVVVVLKGAPTAVASPSGHVTLNSTGNPGMATAGAGDVLAGVIAGLWAQHVEPDWASVAGVYLHGLAGDIACEKFGQKSLVAGDILDSVPAAFRRIEE